LDSLDSNPHQNITVQTSSAFSRAGRLDKMSKLNNLEEIKSQAQRHYADALLKNLQTDLLAMSGPTDTARLRSCAGPKASSWLNCIPKLDLFKLCPADFRCSVRLRLGLPILAIRTDVRCKCGVFPDSLGIHYLTCTTGNHLSTRHELVVKAFHEMVLATGKHSATRQLEQVLAGFSGLKGNRLVLDQLVNDWTSSHEDIGIDFAVCHPCAPAYRSAAAANDLAAAGIRENGKDQKYAGPCQAHDISFKGAVMEVYGAMNQNCVDLVKQASKLLSNELAQGTSTTWTAASFASFHQQRISIALQRANAKAIRYRALRDFQASDFTGIRRS